MEYKYEKTKLAREMLARTPLSAPEYADPPFLGRYSEDIWRRHVLLALSMTSPVSRLSRLSLEAMPPTTRSRSQAASGPLAPSRYDSDEDSSSDLDSDSTSSLHEEGTPSTARSPTKLLYRLDELSGSIRNTVRDTFSDPPKIALQGCRRIDDTYAFQMTEMVPRSVRIRASGDSDGHSHLSCSCWDSASPESSDDDHVCPHLVWLLDQVLKQTLYHHNRADPVTMDPAGHARELGDPFRTISYHRLDVLAADLHCPVVDPSAYGRIDRRRALEARELLSSIYAADPDRVLPEIFDNLTTAGTKVLKRHDLDRTVTRMLLDNSAFFRYFHSLSRATDPINDPFRKLSQRVDLVVSILDQQPSPSVPWAAYHILGCVELVRSSIFSRDRPLRAPEALSAASTLVHILDVVISRNHDVRGSGPRNERNLYLCLVGDRDRDFVIGVLALLPEAASQFLNDFERFLDQIGVQGAPAPYVDRFRALLARLRNPGVGSGLKRPGQREAADRGQKKRMK